MPITQNSSFAGFTFPMTVNGIPTASLPVTATKYLSGTGPTSCVNAVVEIGLGLYKIDLASTDTASPLVTLRFTAPGAEDRIIDILTST
jgi:hypothetical protein